MGAGAGFGLQVREGTLTPTDLGDAEAEGGGLGVGLAGINHHQALVLGERQVPPSGDVPDAERLAPAQVAPAPATKGEGTEGRRTAQCSHGHHRLGPNLIKLPAFFGGVCFPHFYWGPPISPSGMPTFP